MTNLQAILNGEKLRTSPLESEMEKGLPTVSIYSQYCVGSLKTKTRKRFKQIKMGKKK